MSYPSQGYGPPGAGDGAPSNGTLQKGSVRAARERMMAAQQAQAIPGSPQQPPPIRENPLMSQYSFTKSQTPPRPPPPMQPSVSDDEPPTPEPSPGPQWPLIDDVLVPRAPPRPDGPPRQTPQRPPRPPNSATFLDPLSPDNNDGPYYVEDDYLSPTSYSSPNPNRQTSSSMASTGSSLGSIPDFPVPSNAMPPPRRMQILGPPPSSRRGPSSYYSQASYVSPIYEESETRTSKGSFASSNVIPSGVPEFYLEEGEGENLSDDEGADIIGMYQGGSGPIPEQGLVRQASLGKRAKPTLTRVNSTRSSPPQTSSQDRQQKTGTPGGNSMGSGSVLLDPSTSGSSSEEDFTKAALGTKSTNRSKDSLRNLQSPTSLEMISGLAAAYSTTKSPAFRKDSQPPVVSPVDPSVERILGGLEKGGALDPNAANQLRQVPKSGLGDRVGARRPARLNVDAVREAEARGSMTSLPDLIRRATRLAANLDQGKTASRFGMDWMFEDMARERRNASNDKLSSSSANKEANRRSGGSLADMINAFPNPGISTPDRGTPTDGHSAWPSVPSSRRQLNSGREPESGQKRRGRRCCGLPIKGFIFLLLVILILIAVAVIIPVVLIVLPKKDSAAATSAQSQMAQCGTKNPCANGGSVTVLSDGSCGCVCANGFTGPSCLNAEDAGCGSISLAGTNNATVGKEISSLLSKAPSKYSIPLDGASILSLFAQSNFSCSAENALVTFTGLTKTQKRSNPTIISIELSTTTAPTLDFGLRPRTDNDLSAVTSGGLVIDGHNSATSTAGPSSTASATSTSATQSATLSGNSPGTNSTSQDFAKVGILFVMQQSSSIDIAVTAQQKLEQFLVYGVKEGVGPSPAMNVSIGSNYFINLVDLTVTLANGTVYGRGFNGTATAITTRAA